MLENNNINNQNNIENRKLTITESSKNLKINSSEVPSTLINEIKGILKVQGNKKMIYMIYLKRIVIEAKYSLSDHGISSYCEIFLGNNNSLNRTNSHVI